jgi:deoxyhypusine monooxygenase
MDVGEHAMVRHEAAEALGSIGDDRCLKLLQAFSRDAEPIVAESCVVALDMLEHEQSGEFQYADTGHPASTVPSCA